MNLTNDEVLLLIGSQTVELFVLRRRVAQLERDGQQQVAALREHIEQISPNGHKIPIETA